MNKLTPVQSELLKILESFMHDKAYELPADFHDMAKLEQLFKFAQVHKLASVVFEQIRTDAVWQKEEFQGLFAFSKRSAVREVMMQMQRTDGFLNIYEKLGAEGVKPLIIKGLICRNLYTKSDYRTSGDEDILLPRAYFEKCDAIMLENGFSREELEGELPYEIPYINKQNGTYIELHFSLFPEESGAYGHLKNRSTGQPSGADRTSGSAGAANSVQIGMGRVELLKKYDIIE